MKKRLLAILLLIAGLVSMIPSSVSAISTPDTAPSVNAVFVYNLSDGGVGVLVDYSLDYASLPNETAAQSFLAVFVDTDGTTQLKAVAPFPFVDKGYGRGVVWIPFTAAEATTFGLDSSLSGSYRIWLIGNPTLTWTPADIPPKTIANIDSWITTGDPKVMLALQVLNYASILESAWTVDMIQVTTLGQKLTANGESYFDNVIPNVRTLAPAAFAAQAYLPTMESINYSGSFGAIAVSSVLVGSPLNLSSGTNNLVTTGAGTISILLTNVTYGNITGAVVTGTPVDLSPGTNNVSVTGAGAVVVNVASVALPDVAGESINGTGFDPQPLATSLGMSRNMVGGLIWLIVTVFFCAAAYKTSSQTEDYTGGAGRSVFLVFVVCCIGGAVLGIFPTIAVVLLFMASGATIGYIMFFRYQPDIGRTVMFMLWMFIVVGIASNTLQGQQDFVNTQLATTISATDSVITVQSTDGFPGAGIIDINGERIAYGHKTATTFEGSGFLAQTNPLVRGSGGTEAASHISGESVTTVRGAMFNSAMSYNLAVIADPSGAMAFVSVSKAFFGLLGSFMFLPLNFLGTDLSILTVFWAVFAIGLLTSVTIALSFGRRTP